MMRRVLVTGRGGQLATALGNALPAMGFDVISVGRPDFDFESPASISSLLAASPMDVVVNCAAWTAVDAAEDSEAAAFRANVTGPHEIARFCALVGVPLIHISTDYVFDGCKGAPYIEEDEPNPRSVYGCTKLAGERAALSASPMVIVLRTAWIYAATGRNFVRTMLRLGAERPELRVVADQYGNPTAAPDLADAIGTILGRIRETGWQERYRGVFHATATGATSWHGFAEAVFEDVAVRAKCQPVIRPIATRDYPTKAIRPTDSRLDATRLASTFCVTLPAWRVGLNRVLRELGV